MDALIENGPEGMRIAGIARRLDVTSGSFYWHFEGRDDFRDQLLARWLEVLERAATRGGPAGRPTKFGELRSVLVTQRLPDLDLAMRSWARRDPLVARSVARADELRMRLATRLLRAAGLDQATAARRAPLLLWAHIGSSGADPAVRGPALADLARLLPTPEPSRARTSPGRRRGRRSSRRVSQPRP
jgi:AcrR family transcriptional regulator